MGRRREREVAHVMMKHQVGDVTSDKAKGWGRQEDRIRARFRAMG